MSPRLGFDRGELQGEVEPSELGFNAGDILLQQRGEVPQLGLNPVREIPDLDLLRPGGCASSSRSSCGDGLLAVGNGLQDREGAVEPPSRAATRFSSFRFSWSRSLRVEVESLLPAAKAFFASRSTALAM